MLGISHPRNGSVRKGDLKKETEGLITVHVTIFEQYLSCLTYRELHQLYNSALQPLSYN